MTRVSKPGMGDVTRGRDVATALPAAVETAR